jgi:hypothetical protein
MQKGGILLMVVVVYPKTVVIILAMVAVYASLKQWPFNSCNGGIYPETEGIIIAMSVVIMLKHCSIILAKVVVSAETVQHYSCNDGNLC